MRTKRSTDGAKFKVSNPKIAYNSPRFNTLLPNDLAIINLTACVHDRTTNNHSITVKIQKKKQNT